MPAIPMTRSSPTHRRAETGETSDLQGFRATIASRSQPNYDALHDSIAPRIADCEKHVRTNVPFDYRGTISYCRLPLAASCRQGRADRDREPPGLRGRRRIRPHRRLRKAAWSRLVRARPERRRQCADCRSQAGAAQRSRPGEFSAEFLVLRPVDSARSNGTLLYEVNNRGNIAMLAPAQRRRVRSNDPATAADAGNGFLFRRGFTLVWSAWASDVAATPGDNRLVLRAADRHQRRQRRSPARSPTS